MGLGLRVEDLEHHDLFSRAGVSVHPPRLAMVLHRWLDGNAGSTRSSIRGMSPGKRSLRHPASNTLSPGHSMDLRSMELDAEPPFDPPKAMLD